jgi:hypothetical protein
MMVLDRLLGAIYHGAELTLLGHRSWRRVVCRAGHQALTCRRRGSELGAIDLGTKLGSKISGSSLPLLSPFLLSLPTPAVGHPAPTRAHPQPRLPGRRAHPSSRGPAAASVVRPPPCSPVQHHRRSALAPIVPCAPTRLVVDR